MNELSEFEDSRQFLFGLAYRLLGSRAEAEDAVQDTYLKWRAVDRSTLANPRAYLTSVCTRRCIDQLRAAHHARVDYVGTWLPEPIHLIDERSAEASAELSSSLATAFLLLLDRLAPKERAAYLLHEVFDLGYDEVASALGVNEAACRKLVQRGRAGVGTARAGHAPPRERQSQLLAAFHRAVSDGGVEPLARMLAEDVVLRADGGGKVPTLRETLQGQAAVLGFVAGPLRDYWRGYAWRECNLNGMQGVLLCEGDRVVGAVSLGWDEHARANAIYIVRNPDKLQGLTP